MRASHSLLLLAVLSAPLGAQRGAARAGGNGTVRNAITTSAVAVGAVKAVWEDFAKNVAAAAQDMPEAKYSFKATPAVRSFGQLIAHVAGSQYMFCAAVLGETGKDEGDIEKTKTTKADLIAALKASTEYCDKAFAITDLASRAPIELFGMKQTKLWALTLVAAHDAEQYGSISTYLRLNNMVPPSSKK